MDMVRQHGQISVEQLCNRFESSAETIRRDLSLLSTEGKILKYHGGARLPLHIGEGPFQQRMRENLSAKRSIAKIAASLVESGSTIFVDTGTTNLILAEELATRTSESKLTIVTNSLEIARVIGNAPVSHRLYLLGGEYFPENRETAGSEAIQQLRSFQAHHAFITVTCVDERAGATNFKAEEAQVAREMISRAQTVTMLADSSKFDRNAGFQVGPLKAFHNIVCELPPGDKLMKALNQENIQVLY